MNVLPASETLALGRLGEAFGDPTRRLLYSFVSDAQEGLTATEAGRLAGLHRTVARGHLERLLELGLLTVARRKGPGGGRPSKVYLASRQPMTASLPPRRYERLASLLLDALSRSSDGKGTHEAAEASGWAFGREIAAAHGLSADEPTRLSPEDTQAWLDDNGYRATVTATGEQITLRIENCVFRELALASGNTVCALDQALIRGLLGLSRERLRVAGLIAAGDPCCLFEFLLPTAD